MYLKFLVFVLLGFTGENQLSRPRTRPIEVSSSNSREAKCVLLEKAVHYSIDTKGEVHFVEDIQHSFFIHSFNRHSFVEVHSTPFTLR